MAICSRCLGFYPAILVGILLCFIFPFLIALDEFHFFYIAGALMVPMAVDGLTQYVKWRESNNTLRLITGILAGIGAGMLFGRILVDLI